MPAGEDDDRISEEEGDDGEMEAEHVAPSQNAIPECLSTAGLLARRETMLQEKKAVIADIASSLVENPEDNVSTSNVTQYSLPDVGCRYPVCSGC